MLGWEKPSRCREKLEKGYWVVVSVRVLTVTPNDSETFEVCEALKGLLALAS